MEQWRSTLIGCEATPAKCWLFLPNKSRPCAALLDREFDADGRRRASIILDSLI